MNKVQDITASLRVIRKKLLTRIVFIFCQSRGQLIQMWGQGALGAPQMSHICGTLLAQRQWPLSHKMVIIRKYILFMWF